MRKTRLWIAMGCCLFAATQFASAQSSRKPGLWEVTSTMNMAGMQMPQLPPGVQMPPGAGGSPFGPHTTQICVTQAMIDKYGGPTATPPSRNSDCKMTDISIKPTGMTATMVCTGQMNGTGTVEATFTDANTAHTKVHLTGTMQMGPNSRPVDMTMDSTSVYKGPDCGSVKPIEMPTK
jgi:hypothetical protein